MGIWQAYSYVTPAYCILLDLLAEDKMDPYTVCVRGLAQIPSARLPGRLNFLQCCLIVVGHQYRTCFMSHFLRPGFDVSSRVLENLCIFVHTYTHTHTHIHTHTDVAPMYGTDQV